MLSKPLVAGCLVTLLLLIPHREANAAVVVTSSGAGTASIVRVGPANFSGGGISGTLSLEDTLIQKTIDTLGDLTLDVTFSSGDLDFAGGFRWTERVFNNTGTPWTDFHMALITNGTFFSDLPVFSPALVSINSGGVLNSGGTNSIAFLTGATLSLDKKELDVVFGSPIASGSFFDIHSPIEGLSNTTAFRLVETPSVAVPEPATLALLGLGLAGLGFSRRNQ